MTTEELEAAFEKFNSDDDYAHSEFLKFDRIAKPMHRRPDLCAFLMLDAALPSAKPIDMVSAAEHDEIFLDVDLDELAEVATEEMVRDLVRCGVRLDAGNGCLAMFV